MTINELIIEAHETALKKGWWDDKRPFGDQISNMHAELSEVWEEYRTWGLNPERFLYYSTNENLNNKPEGIASEFADVLIRIFDTCGKYGIPLEKALEEKMKYNKDRPYRHGNKYA